MKRNMLSLALGLVFLVGCTNQTAALPKDETEQAETSELQDGCLPDMTFDRVNQNTEGVPKDPLEQLSNDLVRWGPGKQRNELNQPLDPLKLEDQFAEYQCDFIEKTQEKKISLTFDNGYENGYTSKILDILKEKKVTAVFFLTYDYVRDEPELVQRMIEEGHEVGNHSYYHSSFPKVTLQKAKDNIEKLHGYMLEKFGYEMKLFRFPMGEFSERTLALVESYGYKTLFWSFAYKDWEENNQMGGAKALETMKKGLHPGAIYLLHAVSKDNAEILGEFIDYVKGDGYTFTDY